MYKEKRIYALVINELNEIFVKTKIYVFDQRLVISLIILINERVTPYSANMRYFVLDL